MLKEKSIPATTTETGNILYTDSYKFVHQSALKTILNKRALQTSANRPASRRCSHIQHTTRNPVFYVWHVSCKY